MKNQIQRIKNWLGTGSINIFGLPMSGKDTQGVRLAEALDAKFLSSGMIIRAMEKEIGEDYTSGGNLAPTNLFYKWVLPYFERRDLFKYPLILSSIGRWYGEEVPVMTAAASAGHDIKAVIFLKLSKKEVVRRFETARMLKDRGDRNDDDNLEVFKKRLSEFKEKTMPVLEHYRELDLLIEIDGDQSRDAVFAEIVEKLSSKIS